MAKSSISFGSGSPKHNDRSIEIDYLLPSFLRKPNEISNNAKEAYEKVRYLYEGAKQNMLNNFGQKLQSTSYVLEAIINLNINHDMSDLDELVSALEKDTGFTCYQKSIHRDEGVLVEYPGKFSSEWKIEDYNYDSEQKKWFDISGKEVLHFKTYRMGSNIFEKDQIVYTDKQCTQPLDMSKIHVKYNYHAHVNFFTLDKTTGKQLYRKDISPSDRRKVEQTILQENPHLEKGIAKSRKRKAFNKVVREKMFAKGFVVYNRLKMSQLQTLVADILRMERGRVSVKEEADRLGIKMSSPQQRLSHKQLKQANESAENTRLEMLAKLKDVNTVNKELRAELQTKTFEAPEEKRKAFAELEAGIKLLREKARAKNLTIEELEEKVANLSGCIKARDEYIEVMEEEYSKIEIALFGEDEERSVDTLVEEVHKTKSKVAYLEETIYLFTQEIIDKGKSLFIKAFKYFYKARVIDIEYLKTMENNQNEKAEFELEKVSLVLSLYSLLGKVTQKNENKYVLENDEQKTFIANWVNSLESSKTAQNELLKEKEENASSKVKKDDISDSKRTSKSRKNRS